jgi:mono/diheme cytochrome c family protein
VNVPVPLRLAAIAVGATAFYTWVGQMVPQKEVQPPQVVNIAKDVTTAQMVEIGKGIFEGKGLCHTCHKIGGSGPARFPDLAGIGERAATRIPGMSGLAYLAHSIYEPDSFIVPGFIKGMPTINKPPIGLTDDEIKAVIAYLQSLGGTPTITMATQLVDDKGHLLADIGGEAGAAAPAAAAAAGSGDATAPPAAGKGRG